MTAEEKLAKELEAHYAKRPYHQLFCCDDLKKITKRYAEARRSELTAAVPKVSRQALIMFVNCTGTNYLVGVPHMAEVNRKR